VGDEEDPPPATVAVDLERNGPFPVGLASALARGLPAVVLAGSLAAEVAGEGALALPTTEPVLVAEAIGELLARPELGAELGEAGRAAVAHLWGAEAEGRVVAALATLLAP
jgi:glycosyltransferase involved in cell wall biosynthesis